MICSDNFSVKTMFPDSGYVTLLLLLIPCIDSGEFLVLLHFTTVRQTINAINMKIIIIVTFKYVDQGFFLLIFIFLNNIFCVQIIK